MNKGRRARKNPLMPMLYALNALGRTPFNVDSSGDLLFSPASLPTAWAVASIVSQCILVLHFLSLSLRQPASWRGWDRTITTVTDSLVLATVFHAVAVSWWATPTIVDAVNRWNKFQDTLAAVTRRSDVRSTVLNYSHVGVVAILAYVTATSLADKTVFAEPSLFQIVIKIVYSLCAFYVDLLFWLWFVFCLMVKSAAENLKEDLIKSIASSTGPEPQTLSSRRLLWTELHSCTVALSHSLGRTMQLWLGQTLLVVLLDVYGLLMYTLYDPSLERSLRMLAGFANAAATLFLCFTFSDRAQDSISGDISSTLFRRRWLLASKPVRVELDLLLESLETDKPCFVIRGIVMFDKFAIISVFEILCTYLVVLMQFKMAAESID